MATDRDLLALLADGRFHSAASLGARLGLGRSGVRERLQALAPLGVGCVARPGHGYRLPAAVELLCAERIRGGLHAATRARLRGLEVLLSVDSTNSRLMARARDGEPGPALCLAETQTAGRGRRGRTWVSPFGGNLYLSLLYTIRAGAAGLGGLSLALGCAVAEALAAAGAAGVALKWPNDLQAGGAKLGGLLVEVLGEARGPARVVAGLGLNLRMPAGVAAAVDQPWTDLASLTGSTPQRNALAVRLIEALLGALTLYDAEGFAPFAGRWQAYDALRDRPVRLHGAGGERAGIARGVDADGALLLETRAGTERVLSGEVSVRAGA